MRKPINLRLVAAITVLLVALTLAVSQTLGRGGTQPTGTSSLQGAQDGTPTAATSLPEATDAPSGDAVTDAATGVSTDASANGTSAASDESAPLATAVYTQTGESLFEMPEGAQYEPQVVLVRLSQDASDTNLDELLASMPGVRLKERVTDGLVSLELDEGISVENAVNGLLASGSFDDAQPNFIYTAMEELGSGEAGLSAALAADETPEPVVPEGTDNAGDAAIDASDDTVTDDTESIDSSDSGDALEAPEAETLSLAETLQINDPLSGALYHLDDVRAREAWTIARGERDASGKAVTVGVIDVGFDADHEDLVNNVTLRYNALDGSTDVANTVERSKHGTHVAGVISAQANNGKGVAGVSYNANMALVRVADTSGRASSATIARAYDYLMEKKDELNLRVINISLGAAWASSSYTEQDKLLMSKIDEAHASGVVTVAAAGNGTSSTSVPYAIYPGDLSNVTSVINIDQNHNKATASNYNREGEYSKNISAPGSQILSSHGTSTVTYKGITYMGYSYLSGTSTAAPCVSGILALVFAANPSLSPEEAVDILYGTASDLGDEGWDKIYGYGEAMALDAVQGALGARLDGPRYLAVGDEMTPFSVSGSEGVEWTYSSSDSSVVSIDSVSGYAEALKSGRADVMATGNGVTLTKTVSVFSGVQGSDSVDFGKVATYSIEKEFSDYQSWKWSSSDPSVATVAADSGVLTTVAAGTTMVTATLVADPSLSFSKEVEVVASGLDGVVVSPVAARTYAGVPITPSVTVTKDGKILSEVTDYTLKYSDNVNVGTAHITIVGKGGFSGSTVVDFEIERAAVQLPSKTELPYTGEEQLTPLAGNGYVLTGQLRATEIGNYTVTARLDGNHSWTDGSIGDKELTWSIVGIDIAEATIAPIPDQVYDGTLKRPDVTVTMNDRELVLNTDYTLSYRANINPGVATAIIRGRGNYTGETTAKFKIVDEGHDVQTQEMYRLYNPNSGEHFYTADAAERDNLASLGWNYEGIGWIAPLESSKPVYRVYNPVAGEHHYTMDASEKNSLVAVGWQDEGIGWYSDIYETIPLLREYNPNQFACNHNYTTSREEHDYLVSLGWRDEGIGWYAVDLAK